MEMLARPFSPKAFEHTAVNLTPPALFLSIYPIFGGVLEYDMNAFVSRSCPIGLHVSGRSCSNSRTERGLDADHGVKMRPRQGAPAILMGYFLLVVGVYH